MGPAQNRLLAREILPLVQRLLETESDLVVEERDNGICFFCHAEPGPPHALPRLFAVATDGGMLLRLPPEVRGRAIDAGIAESNSVLPKWVLQPPRQARHDATPKPDGHGFDEQIHGAPEDWVWVPIRDHTTFERRKPHLLEALAYGRHEALASLAKRRDPKKKDDH